MYFVVKWCKRTHQNVARYSQPTKAEIHIDGGQGLSALCHRVNRVRVGLGFDQLRLLDAGAIELVHVDLESGLLGGGLLRAAFAQVFIFARQGL